MPCPTWGTAGILQRKFITAEEALGTWDILWDSKNRGKILMKDSYRDAYGTAIIYAHARATDSTVTVEQLMNDNSPHGPSPWPELTPQGDETQHRRLGSRLRQGMMTKNKVD